MGKKILYVFAMIIGGLLLLMFIISIPNIISEVLSNQSSPYKTGYILGSLLFPVSGFLLIRWSYRKLNPKESKRKDSIEDIGTKL